jgi:4-amino-4-deoxy-L-arabinose transferase-like glycosyltransferase
MPPSRTPEFTSAHEERCGPVWRPRDRLALAAIFLVALLLRILHLQQIYANDPFFAIPAVDGRLYQAWAHAIAGGDWVGRDVLILGPFYAYFMAAVEWIFGPSLLTLKLLQAVIGALDCLLVAVLARIYFARGTALLAGALTAVYGMLIFYGGAVMIVNVQVPLVLLLLIAAARALREPTAGRWLLAGLLLGASALARQTTLLFAPLLVGWLLVSLHDRHDRLPVRRRAALVAVFSVGLAALILPFTLRNLVVGDDLVLINSTGGANLYMGHNPRSDGTWVPPLFSGERVDNPIAMRTAFTHRAEMHEGRKLRPSEVSTFWSRQALAYAIGAPGDWIRLELRKLLLFFNAREVWNNRSHTISREFSWVLRLPLLTFGVLAPFALLGLGFGLARWRELLPLYAMVLVYLTASLAFFVLSRYRMPIVPILMIFAAHAIARIHRAIRARNVRLPALAAGWLIVLGIFTNLDMGSENLHMAYYNLGNKYRDLGRFERAIESYRRSLAIAPGFVSSKNNLALAFEGAGHSAEAIEAWKRVLAWSVEHGDDKRRERATRHLGELGVEATSPETPE